MTFLLLLSSTLVLLLLYLIVRYNFLMPSVKGLPILMYHKITPDENSFLSVSVLKLKQHFNYLQQNDYRTIHFSEFLEIQKSGQKIPPKTIILTFDDAYLNNYVNLYPLLKQYKFKASIMLPVHYIGKSSAWDSIADEIMNYEQLKELDSELVEFGLHSYAHFNYRHASIEESEKDIIQAISELNNNNLKFTEVLVYPYGGFPRDKKNKKLFVEMLQKNGIKLGLRIGNKINKIPLKAPYEVCRIDIRGTDSSRDFSTKVKKGRVKLF
jgi:peptidoglycan/xylan/chitin deacetylase (PgdA/CDA1 family)